MRLNFSDVINVNDIENLLKSFYAATGMPSAITDVDGEVLVAVAWQDICTKYHRINPETELLCRKSDRYMESRLNDVLTAEKAYVYYECANGLIDAAAPIIIDGVYLASIYTGQFFFEKPDREKFRQQAQKYRFDETGYLRALDKVPVISKLHMDSAMTYFIQLAHILAEMGLIRIKLLESQEQVIRENENRLKTIIDNTPHVAVRSYNSKGKALYWNKTAERILGKSNIKSMKRPGRKIDAENQQKSDLLEIISSSGELRKSIGPLEWTLSDEEGPEKTIYSTIFPISFGEANKEFICIDVDITERKRFEKEMARLEQLNLIGEMAASIGHEVRNPMTTVRGYLQMLGEKDDWRKYKSQIDIMIEELDRANSIITEFLALAKNKRVKLEKNSLNSIILALAPLIKANAIVKNIGIKIELGKVSQVLLDEKEIRQVILNLTCNSIEAMGPGGRLTIKTLQDNTDVVLIVKDQGPGIPPELMDKIGTPFFSTKENGTGMGLAVCYSIAARHNAKIEAASSTDGTTFSVRFQYAPVKED